VSQRISAFEKNTGYELIIAAAKSSDPYPGAAWRGALLISLLVSALILHFWNFEPRSLEVLLVGLVTLLFVMLLRKCHLHYYFALPSEIERETLQEAQATYSHFQSDSLGHHASVLVYLSLQEHKIHLLTARELQLSDEDLDLAIIKMSHKFKEGSYAEGLVEAIGVLETKILNKVGRNPHPIHLSIEDRVFWKEE
jgi:uncharacterized membrane protein